MLKALHHLAGTAFATRISLNGRLTKQRLGKGKCHGQFSATFRTAKELGMRNAPRFDLSAEALLDALLGDDGSVKHRDIKVIEKLWNVCED